MCSYTTYIDEAGNTYTDLQNTDQPYFVIAAVSVPKENRRKVLEVRKNNFEAARQPNDKELKGRIWVKRQKKQKALRNIIDELQDNDCIISVVVIDKRRMIMPLAVNKFFDYFLNGSNDCRWMNGSGYDKLTAEYYINELSDAEVDIVYQAFDAPSRNSYMDAIIVLKTHALDQSWKDMLDCSMANVQELLQENDNDGDGLLSDGASHSPNVTAYYSLVNNHVRELADRKADSFIVFDHCKECNKDFEKVYQLFNKLKTNVKMTSWFDINSWQCIKGFDVADSKKDLGLQFADIIASSVYFMLLSKKDGNPLNDFEQYIEALLLEIANKGQYLEVC